MTFAKLFLGAGLALCLSQQVSAKAPDLDAVPAYSAAEVAWSRGAAAARIEGHAAGAGKTCAGEKVWLRPRSKLEDHRNRVIFGNLEAGRIPILQFLDTARSDRPDMPVPPQSYDDDARKVVCAADGTFVFEGLPDGEYYVLVMILPAEFVGKLTPVETIELVMRRVSVASSATTEADLLPAP